MEILIPEYKIERRVRALAHKITEDHRNSGNSLPPVLVCVLNGAFMFFSDLVKDMGTDCEIDFIRPKSYHGQDNSGGVKFYKELDNKKISMTEFINLIIKMKLASFNYISTNKFWYEVDNSRDLKILKNDIKKFT